MECGDGIRRTMCASDGIGRDPRKVESMMEDVTVDIELPLARSGHVHGVRLLLEEGNSRDEITCSMLACGVQLNRSLASLCWKSGCRCP